MEERFLLRIGDARTTLARFARQQRGWRRTSLCDYPIGVAVMPREAADTQAFADELAGRLRQDHPGGLTCRLVVPTSWCFTDTVNIAASRWSEQAAAFEFEQHLPVDLEALSCTARRTADRRTTAVGVFADAVLSLLSVLESANVHVDSIVVDALALGRGNGSASPETAVALVLVDDRHVTLTSCGLLAHAADPLHTITLAGDEPVDLLEQQLLTAAGASMPPEIKQWEVLSIGGEDRSQQVARVLEAAGESVVLRSADDSIDRLLGAAVASTEVPDLRRNRLAYAGRWSSTRTQLYRLAATLTLLLAVTGVRLRLDRSAYAHGLSELEPARTALYQEVFPGSDVGPASSLRLQSERIKLEGLTETAMGAGSLAPTGTAVLTSIRDVVQSVPDSLKLFLTELTANETVIRISGQTTSHTAAGELVGQLNSINEWAFDPPTTKLRKDGTVEFRIVGKRKGEGTE